MQACGDIFRIIFNKTLTKFIGGSRACKNLLEAFVKKNFFSTPITVLHRCIRGIHVSTYEQFQHRLPVDCV